MCKQCDVRRADATLLRGSRERPACWTWPAVSGTRAYRTCWPFDPATSNGQRACLTELALVCVTADYMLRSFRTGRAILRKSAPDGNPLLCLAGSPLYPAFLRRTVASQVGGAPALVLGHSSTAQTLRRSAIHRCLSLRFRCSSPQAHGIVARTCSHAGRRRPHRHGRRLSSQQSGCASCAALRTAAHMRTRRRMPCVMPYAVWHDPAARLAHAGFGCAGRRFVGRGWWRAFVRLLAAAGPQPVGATNLVGGA